MDICSSFSRSLRLEQQPIIYMMDAIIVNVNLILKIFRKYYRLFLNIFIKMQTKLLLSFILYVTYFETEFVYTQTSNAKHYTSTITKPWQPILTFIFYAMATCWLYQFLDILKFDFCVDIFFVN